MQAQKQSAERLKSNQEIRKKGKYLIYHRNKERNNKEDLTGKNGINSRYKMLEKSQKINAIRTEE